MSALAQLSQKHIEDAPNLALERAERWNNGLRLPLHNIAQNYDGRKLHVLVNLSGDVKGKRYGGVLCIEAGECVQLWTAHVKPGEYQGQFTMLGFPVQVVNQPEDVVKRVGSIVRLFSFDDLLRGVAREYLYFSFKTGRTIFVETFAADGKLNSHGCLFANFRDGQEPCHVIETRPKMVDNFASKDGEPERNSSARMIEAFLREHLKVFITGDWVLALLVETGNFNLKVDDVLVGPF